MQLATEMIKLARKYGQEVDEIHKLYFQVSCDHDKLIKHLNGEKGVVVWTELEDLALKDKLHGLMYIHVVKIKGDCEVDERKTFLEID